MSLWLPRGTTFAEIQHNLSATPSITAGGTDVNGNAAAHQQGSWTELIATTNHDTYGFYLSFSNHGTSGTQPVTLCDIGVGANPNEVVIVSNIPVGGAHTIRWPAHFFPVFIPKGSRVSARIWSSAAGEDCTVNIWLLGGFSYQPWPIFSGCEGIGATKTAGSATSGTTVAPGNNAEGTWTNVGSTTSRQLWAIRPIYFIGAAVSNNNVCQVDVGISSTILASFIRVVGSTESEHGVFPRWPAYVQIPASTQLQVRAAALEAETTAQCVIMGFY